MYPLADGHPGHDFRERERIKFKKACWIERLKTMLPAERYAIWMPSSRFRPVEVMCVGKYVLSINAFLFYGRVFLRGL
jgi:hypothetical protein